MFEGKPPIPVESPSDALRPLEWQDLAGRLAAARDLRASLAPGESEGEGSFDALSARWIAAHREGQELVNPVASGNGKAGDRKGVGVSPASHGSAARES